MNLEVGVKLVDETSRPAKAVTANLDKMGSSATHLATRFTTLTRATRGLVGSLQAVKGTDAAAMGATAATGKLRGTMASLAPASTKAAGGIDKATRSMNRLQFAAIGATKATTGLHGALSANVTGGGFVGSAESQLRSLVGLQKTAIANMGRLNAGSGGRGRSGSGGGGSGGSGGSSAHGAGGSSGMLGHAFFGATSGIAMGGHAIREIFEQGADRVDEYTKMAMSGVDAAQIARNRNAALAAARLIGGSGINGNLATLRHLRFALGSDVEATRALTPVAQATQTMKFMNPNIDAEGNAYAMAKAAEMKGVSQDPKKFVQYMGLMANTAIATGGKTTGQDFRQFTAMSKGTSTFLSPDAYAGLVSSIGGELGAGKTGNALAMSTRANIGGVMTEKGRSKLKMLGLFDTSANTIVKADNFQRDPHRWVEDNLVPVLKANGMLKMDKEGNVDPEQSKAVGKLFAQMFSNSNVAGLFTLLTTQGARYEKDQKLRNKVAIDNFAMQHKSPTYAMSAMVTSFKDMLGTMSEADMPAIVGGLHALTGAFNAVAGMNPKSLGLMTEVAAGFLALGPAVWGARLAYMTFLLPLRQVGAALFVTTAQTGAATVATTGLTRATMLLGTALKGVLASVMAIGAGYKIGSWASAMLDKDEATKDDAGKSDRTKLAGIRTAQRLLEEDNKTWNDPSRGMWAHFRAGQRAEQDRRYLDARGEPYERDDSRLPPAQVPMGTMAPLAPGYSPHIDLPTMTPFGGFRAKGGSVKGGMAYLVGENGPEVLEMGSNGHVSTAGQTRSMLNGLDNNQDSDTPRAIRGLGFELAGSVDGLTRAIERLGMGRTIGNGAGDGSGASAGPHGGDSGGRKGFMSGLGGSGKGDTVGGSGTPGTGGSRSWRNNNPGNIEYGAFAKAHGATGSDGCFAIFPDYASGRKAQEGLLFDSAKYKNLTLAGAIKRWAPASENDVPAYLKAMGGDPNAKMSSFSPAQRGKLLDAMQAHEGWKVGSSKSTGGGADGPRIPGSIVDSAKSMLGMDAARAGSTLHQTMHAGLWCADFVNGMLRTKGIKGSGSAMARSFFTWGKHMDPSQAKAGDVLASQGHVGFAEGPAVMHNGRMMFPMISGNHGHKVGEGWGDARQYEARRGAEMPPVLVERAKKKQEHAAMLEQKQSKGSGHTMHVTNNMTINTQPHHDEHKIAAIVNKHFNDSVHRQLNDGAFA